MDSRKSILLERLCPNCGFPARSTFPVKIRCGRCGLEILLGKEDQLPANKLPRLVRLISAYRIPSDTGVGDTLERLLAKAGGRKFKHLMLLMRLPCGCDDRQAWLNKKWPY